MPQRATVPLTAACESAAARQLAAGKLARLSARLATSHASHLHAGNLSRQALMAPAVERLPMHRAVKYVAAARATRTLRSHLFSGRIHGDPE
jgi:hypothetical protein